MTEVQQAIIELAKNQNWLVVGIIILALYIVFLQIVIDRLREKVLKLEHTFFETPKSSK